MSDTDNSPTPSGALQQALEALPAKPRVHELAKRSGLSSKELIAALAERGVVVKAASSSVDHAAAVALLTELLGDSGTAAADPAAEPADAAAADLPEPSSATPVGGVPLFLAPEPEVVAPPRRTRKAPTKAADEEQTDPAVDSRRTRAATVQAEPGEVEAAEDTAEGASRSRSRSRRGRGRSGDAAQDAPNDEQQDPPAAAESTDEAGESGEAADADGVRRRRRRGRRGRGRSDVEGTDEGDVLIDRSGEDDGETAAAERSAEGEGAGAPNQRRRRRAPVKATDQDDSGQDTDATSQDGSSESSDDADDEDSDGATGSRRRRRRRRGGAGTGEAGREDDPDNTVVHVREARDVAAEVQGIRGSTRLEAKRQRRRDSRDSRRRPQILTEAEFLARRESVKRVMAVRQRGDLAQVALLEDDVLVEHFVSRAGSASMIGNIYLGRVQNVLPSMEAAFVDIGRGRNAVLYAGEVNWDLTGLVGKARRIETALSSGDVVLVQVSKDPVGHKGARLTTQISLPGRFLVYVPAGGATGISRKLPDTERKRLKQILDRIVPDGAGVIIRTAAEGVSEDELAADVERLKSQWESVEAAGNTEHGKQPSAPSQLSAEPDTLIKVIRDLFNSDITSLVIDDEGSSEGAWADVSSYIEQVAPELSERVSQYEGKGDVFTRYRVDEQIAKALERKVHLPSGGSLVIDRTEAMTVVDVNTGKYTGSGGNLEETVTKNNLEAAEEIVRQLRLRDIGGIIVVDFIDMVLESNRELVLRRLTECLGRDRTRHQVAEVTSLGLIQMTRKRMGTGLIEAFSHNCEHCHGRGIVLQDAPTDTSGSASGDSRSNSSNGNSAQANNAGDDSRGDSGRQPRKRRARSSEPEETAEPISRITSLKADPRGPRMSPRRDADDPAADAIVAADAAVELPDLADASDSVLEISIAVVKTTAPETAAPEPAAADLPPARPRRRRASSQATITAGEAVVLTIDAPASSARKSGAASGGATSAAGAPMPVGVAASSDGAAQSNGEPESKGSVSSEAPVARPRRRSARRPAGPAAGADTGAESGSQS